MSGAVAQRWLFGQESWRQGDEPVRARDWGVVRLPRDTEAKAFVEAHHYAHSYVAARERFGLFHRSSPQLLGVAVYSVPVQPRALAVLPGAPEEKLELGRLVLLDEVPGNAESLLVGQSFRQLRREGYSGVVSFSDPCPRSRADGSLLHPGHVGVVYQATNGTYLGRSKPDTLWVLPDGTALTRRSQAKVRKLEQGWRYVAARLVAHGAAPLNMEGLEGEAARAVAASWLFHWRGVLTRPMRHAGNHKYAWGFGRAARHLPPSLPYPEPPAGRTPARWGRRAA